MKEPNNSNLVLGFFQLDFLIQSFGGWRSYLKLIVNKIMGWVNMKNFKSVIVAFIAGICAIACVAIAVNGLVTYKKAGDGGINVTGSVNQDFTADLIVWRGSFSAYGDTTKKAYDKIKKDAAVIKKYLVDSGVSEEEIIFYAINIEQQYETEYDSYGAISKQIPAGYKLYQQVSVESNNVDKIEVVSRDITTLIDSGVEFISEAPEYYYTKLDELKLEMIKSATENAKARVDNIADKANSKVGKLVDASLGVFQITAKNSDSEEYSYGGTFNTSAKEKTASVTVRLKYEVD